MGKTFPFATSAEREALNEIARRAGGVPSIIRIVAFGSRVRGDFHGESDLDLLVIVKEISARSEVIRFLSRIETEFDVSLSPVVYTEHELATNRRMGSGFIRNVQAEGVELYDAECTGKGRTGPLPSGQG